MPELQKLKVIILERHQDPVLLFITRLGIAHFLKVDCEDETYTGILQACPAPDEESLMISEIQTRIKSILEDLDLKFEEIAEDVALLPGDTIREILSNMEKRLIELEEQSEKFLEIQNGTYIDEPSIDEIAEKATLHSTLLALYKMTLDIELLLATKGNMAQCDDDCRELCDPFQACNH